MQLTPKTIESINSKLNTVKKLINLNSGGDIEIIKDELYEIVQQIEEEKHRCFNNFDN
jgi:hypothetical protein|tara:strand:- start:278 stop:451 length:174 start_codon:yes stop_codon:yes gene_type:complete